MDETHRDKRDREVGRVGYSINFNRIFYQHSPQRKLDEIDGDLMKMEDEIAKLLEGVME